MAAHQIAGKTTKKHLVYCWELGQGYGHVLSIRALVHSLLADGWRISAIVAEPHKVRRMLPAAVDVIAMPTLRPEKLYDPTLNLAEVLLNNDFAEPQRLQVRAEQWQRLFGQLQPDVVLIDHAPTALLTAHLLQIRRALLGTGFFISPAGQALPVFSPFRLQTSTAEARLVTQLNQVRLNGQSAQLSTVAELFQQADERFLCTFAQLDHFGLRTDEDYWGAVFDFDYGELPQWQARSGLKIFMYLHADYPELTTVLDMINAMPCNTLVHVGGGQADPGRWPQLRFRTEPQHLGQVAQLADLVICHAGHATIAGMLLRQKPLLLLPKQLEQLILSERLWSQQLALFLPLGGDFSLLPQMIETMTKDQGLRQRLAAFAAYYAGFQQAELTEGMRDALNELAETLAQ